MRTSHILLSYPFGPRGWLTLFNSKTYTAKLKELIEHRESNVLIIYGDQDEFTGVGSYKAWREELQGGDARKVKVVEVAGGSHFWRGRTGDEMREIVVGWLP